MKITHPLDRKLEGTKCFLDIVQEKIREKVTLQFSGIELLLTASPVHNILSILTDTPTLNTI